MSDKSVILADGVVIGRLTSFEPNDRPISKIFEITAQNIIVPGRTSGQIKMVHGEIALGAIAEILVPWMFLNIFSDICFARQAPGDGLVVW